MHSVAQPPTERVYGRKTPSCHKKLPGFVAKNQGRMKDTTVSLVILLFSRQTRRVFGARTLPRNTPLAAFPKWFEKSLSAAVNEATKQGPQTQPKIRAILETALGRLFKNLGWTCWK